MRTALLLIGFQRVDYFEQTLKSLEANVAAHECDLHVYLDGGPKARQSELISIVEASSFNNVTIVRRETNWGIGRHLIDARRTLFDKHGYDRVFLFEDDMFLAPTYVETLQHLLDWSEQYTDVGCVTGFHINHDSHAVQLEQQHHVIATNRHFWGYGMRREVWEDVRDIIYEFEQKYLMKTTYAKRKHRSIRWFFIRKYMKQPRIAREGVFCIPQSHQVPPFAKNYSKAPTSQDAITALALWVKGYHRLTLRVSRAKYVGEEGFSFNPMYFEQMGFNKQNTLDFNQFSSVSQFKLALYDEHNNPLMPMAYQ